MKKREAESINHFPGFETGWYFPESLRPVQPLEIPGLNEAYIPTYEEFLASMQQRLARYALEVEEVGDPALQARQITPPIELPPLPF